VLPCSAPFQLRAAACWAESRAVLWRGRELWVPSPEILFLHTAIHYGFWHRRGVGLRRLWDQGLIARCLSPVPAQLIAAAERCGASRLTRAALWEQEALLSNDPAAREELSRRVRAADPLWTPDPAITELSARARLLDGPLQRLALYRYAILPARAETANATGCQSTAAHLRHFLHPRRLWRGIRSVLLP
jgi:hypothetical protein